MTQNFPACLLRRPTWEEAWARSNLVTASDSRSSACCNQNGWCVNIPQLHSVQHLTTSNFQSPAIKKWAIPFGSAPKPTAPPSSFSQPTASLSTKPPTTTTYPNTLPPSLKKSTNAIASDVLWDSSISLSQADSTPSSSSCPQLWTPSGWQATLVESDPFLPEVPGPAYPSGRRIPS